MRRIEPWDKALINAIVKAIGVGGNTQIGSADGLDDSIDECLVPRLDEQHVGLGGLDGGTLRDRSGNTVIIDGDVGPNVGIGGAGTDLVEVMLEGLELLVHMLSLIHI